MRPVIALALLVLAAPMSAWAAGLIVPVDQSRRIPIGGAAASVVVGNTNIADVRKTASIVDALTNPAYRVQGDGGAIPRKLEPPNTYQAVRITMSDGKMMRGVLKNEDSVSLQVLGVDDSRLHLLERAKLKDVQYERTSLMPRDYKSRLTAEEFQGLVAFLTRQSKAEGKKPER